MPLERHIVVLEARDTLSRTLQTVGREAETAGSKAEDAGRRATRSTQDWGRAASALGAGLGTLAGIAIKLGNDSEVVQRRLQQAVENTGHSYDEYADAIDRASQSALKMAFDDEDAANSIAALTDATGDAGRAITDLALAQDIARGRGIDLAAATNIVIAAETGRIQSLKRMGIALDAGATSQEALAALQTKYAGQAEAFASTNAATWDRWGNTVENKLEAVGAALTDFQGPLIALSAGASALGPLGDAFDALGGKAKLASLGSNALSLALSPAGLLGTASALTAGIVYLVATTDEFTASAKAAERESADLANSYAALAASIDDVVEREQTRQAFAGFSGLQEQAQQDLRTYQELQNAVVEWKSEFPQMQDVAIGALTSINEATQEWLDFNHDGRISLEELTAATEQFGQKALLSSDQAKAIGDNLTAALSHADVDVSAVLDDFAALEAQWQRGEISGQQFADGVEAINRQWGDYTPYALDAAQATNKVTDAVRFATHEWHAAVPAISATTDALDDNTEALDKNTQATGDWYSMYHSAAPVIETTVSQLGLAGQALKRIGDLGGFAASGLGDTAAGAREATTASAELEAQIDTLAQTLKVDFANSADAAYARVVGFTGGMVTAIQRTKEWSDSLLAPLETDFNADGSQSVMLDLMQRGKLDAEDYNEALKAQTQIYGDLARATDAANVIQIKQSDQLAAGTKATADYLENLSELPEKEQALALAWADQDLSGRANEIADLAAGYGDMSKAQQDAFGEMVTSAAALDPQLAGLLESIGLIKRDVNDPTGWSIDMDSSGAESDIDRLNATMGDFIKLFDPTYIANTDINDMGAVARAGIALELWTLDNTTATPDVDADTTLFWQAVNGIAGHTVGTAYIDIVGASSGIGANVGFGALGGVAPLDTSVLDTAALGRVSAGNWTVVGEHGRELVNLPTGALVTPAHATSYDPRAKNGRGDIHFHGDLHFHGVQNPEQFMRQMRTYVTTMARS